MVTEGVNSAEKQELHKESQEALNPPNLNYVTVWDSNVVHKKTFWTEKTSDRAIVNLETKIESTFHDPEQIKKILARKNIPIACMTRNAYNENCWGVEIKGTGGKVGSYTLKVWHKKEEYDKKPENEELSLRAEYISPKDGFGEMQKLVDAVSEYLTLCEKNPLPKKKEPKLKIPQQEAKTETAKKDTVMIDLSAQSATSSTNTIRPVVKLRVTS
jgi:hypothetical protein